MSTDRPHPSTTADDTLRPVGFARWGPYLVLAVLAYVPSLLTRPGWVAADTKQYLYLDPSKLLSSAWSLWNPDVSLGTVTHQNIGYLFPLGPYYWLMAALHIPVWIAQRCWMGSLFFFAGAGVVYLTRRLRFTWTGQLAAGVLYMCTPFVIDYITRISAITMPWAALGWMVAFLLLALQRRGWKYPALFALCVALVGGVNATSILFVGLAPTLLILFVWLVLREVDTGQVLRTVAKVGVLTLGVSLWWIAGLWAEGAYGLNVLKYTETIPTVTSTSLASEVFRGLGYWFFYGRDAAQPWVTPAGGYLRSIPTIALSVGVPAACLLSGFFVRWRYRAYAVWLVLLGVVLAVAAYPLSNPSPFGSVLKTAAESSTVGLAMRSSNRVIPIMVLGLALLAGSAVSALTVHSRRAGTFAMVLAAVLACANLAPLFEGQLVAANLARPEQLPQYVHQAANYLNGVRTTTRVLGVPGEDFAYYGWGTTQDSIWPGLLNRPFVARQAVVQGEAGSANLIRALDEAIQDRTFDSNSLAPIARLMSAGDVLLESDMPTDRYQLPNPQVLYLNQFVPTPKGLAAPVSFGNPAIVKGLHSNVYDELSLATPAGAPYPAPLMTYAVAAPRPIVRAESQVAPLLLAGDGEGLLEAGAVGLLNGDPAVIYSGTASHGSPTLRNVMRNDATLVLTDSNVRRLDTWGTLHSTYGYPMLANEQPLVANPAEATLPLFSSSSSDLQTVAEYPGVAALGASSYSNPITNDLASQPSNAFDGNPNTAWVEGAYQSATGQYVTITFDQPHTVDHLTFTQAWHLGDTRRVRNITISLGNRQVRATLNPSSWQAPGQTVDFPSTTFKTLRVTIDGTTTPNLADYSSANAVGFSEIAIPGATPIAETLRLPTDLLSNAGTHSLSHRLLILLNRLVLSDHPMSRTFTLTTARRFTLTGTTRLNLTITDPQLNAVLGRTGPGASQRVPSGASNYVVGTNASSRLLGSYLASSWSAIDGNPSTAWSPKLGSSIGQWMSVSTSRPTTLSRVTLSLLNDGHHSIPTELTLSDGTHQDTFGVTGVVPPKVARPGQVVTVPVTLTTPLSGQNFTLRVDQVTPPVIPDYIQGGAASLPIGIAELSLPGVVAPSTPLQLPATCRSDLATLDGSPVSISPMGTTAALLANRAIPATTCGASASGLSMQAGTHTFVGVLSPQVPLTLDTVALGSAVGGAPLAWSQTSGFALPATAPALSVQTSHATRTSFDGTYVADGTAKWLVFGQSLSRGWKLTVDGHGIGTLPELIDGYANGWRLPAYPAGTTVHVQVVWAPQKVVNVAIYLSMLGLAVVLGILVAEVVRRRRRGRHRSSVLVRPNQFLADLEPRWHLPWRDELVPLPRSAYVVAGLAVLLGAAFTSPFAIVPLGLGAAVVLVAPRGRFLLGAAIALLLSAAAISVALGAHTYHWNILWPTHFALANSFVWMAVTLAFVEATIELAERRHDLLAITAPAWPTTTPRPPTPPPPVPTDAIADTPAAGAPAWSLPTGDAEVARVTPVPSPSAAASSTPAVPVAAAALGWATPTGATATPQGDESQDEREVLGGSPTGLRRSLMLYRAFKVEQSDPDHFYRTLAEDTASQLAGYAPLYNRILVDIGGGPGYFSEAFEERGARCLLVEPEARPVELRPPGLPFASNDERHDYAVLPGRLHRARTVAGDGMRLPLPDNCCDIAFSSNVLEHVPDPAAFIDESLRITKPNGTVYLSYTVWSSPWGGHETSPWHLFGGRYAARRYERKHGRPPGNLYGQSLFKVRVREVLKLVRDRDDVAKLWAFPRYYPAWAAWIIHVPVLREFVTWNLVVVLRKDAPRTTRGAFDRSSRPARRTPPPPSPAN